MRHVDAQSDQTVTAASTVCLKSRQTPLQGAGVRIQSVSSQIVIIASELLTGNEVPGHKVKDPPDNCFPCTVTMFVIVYIISC